MDALSRLVAMEEIRDLIARYGTTYDDHDWEGFGELWTDDAAFAVDGVAFEGRTRMLEFLTTCLPEDYTGKHICSNTQIVLAEDGQTATAMTDVLWVAQNFENSILGRYHDTFRKHEDRWLFSRREERTVPFKPGAPPYSEAALAVSGATMRT
jgi:uncharacterized protein (TIGR02246 family)